MNTQLQNQNKILKASRKYLEDLYSMGLKPTDAGYEDWIERLKEAEQEFHNQRMEFEDMKDALKEVILLQKELEIEKNIYGGITKDEYEKQAQERIDVINAEIEALQKKWELEAKAEERANKIKELEEAKTKLLHVQNGTIGSLTKEQAKQLGLEQEREKILEHEIEMQELQNKLANVKSQNKIQQLQMLEDGSYDFNYVADQKEIDSLEKEIKDKQEEYDKWQLDLLDTTLDNMKTKQEEYDKWELEQAREKQLEELRAQIEHEQNIMKEKEKAFEEMKQLLKDNYDPENPDSVNVIVNEGLKAINKIYEEKYAERVALAEQNRDTIKSIEAETLGMLDSIKNAREQILALGNPSTPIGIGIPEIPSPVKYADSVVKKETSNVTNYHGGIKIEVPNINDSSSLSKMEEAFRNALTTSKQ